MSRNVPECSIFWALSTASSIPFCGYFTYRMFDSSSVNASATFELFPLPSFFKSFASSFQTFPCLVGLFVVDKTYGIFAFFKTFLASFFRMRNSLNRLNLTYRRVFARVFLFYCSWMFFLTGLTKAINLFELSVMVCGLWLVCEKTGVNLWKLNKLP